MNLNLKQASTGSLGHVGAGAGGDQGVCGCRMSPGHPPSGEDDRPLVEPIRVGDLEGPPVDRAESSGPPDDAAGVVRCGVSDMERCRTDSPRG